MDETFEKMKLFEICPFENKSRCPNLGGC